MASRLVNCWRSMASRLGATRAMTTAPAPRMKAYAPAATEFTVQQPGSASASLGVSGDFVPVYVALGLITLSLSFGALTAKQQLMYSPNVRLSKKRRESLPEVDDPDRVVTEAERLVKKSLFRKVAHVQDFDAVRAGPPDPTRTAPLDFPHHVETLKSVGVDPRGL